ncbi:MAG TPA: ferritin family protein [Polyangiaceae bacterium]
MDDINLFLAHAIQLERDAARRFEDLMHSMQTAGNRELEGLFRRLGELSRLHLSSAVARGGFHSLPELSPADFQWPEGETPEAADWQGVDSLLDANGALRLALAGERTGQAWYSAVAKTTTDPEVLSMAREFAEEEAQHVSELERWIARRPTPQ